jgi:hypothetical protein
LDKWLDINSNSENFNWERFVGFPVKVIDGGCGAMGANGKIGQLIPKNTKCISGTCDSESPKIKIDGINWSLSNTWRISIYKSEIKLSYSIYGKHIIPKKNINRSS